MNKAEYKKLACGIIASCVRSDIDNCSGGWADEQGVDEDKLAFALKKLAAELERRSGNRER